MNTRKLSTRLSLYFFGLFLMTIGIALSVKSNLGVSPISSIPYTVTCVWGLEMGKATIIFHAVLVLLQLLILRKDFKCINLLQIIVGIVFGYFTTFCNWGVLQVFPNQITNIAVRIIMVLGSTVFVAIGIFFYMPASIMPLAGEGCMMAVAQITGIMFHKVKIMFDITMVIISLTTCILFLHSMGSVGVGTVIAAVLVGVNIGWLNRFFGSWRDRLLGVEKKLE